MVHNKFVVLPVFKNRCIPPPTLNFTGIFKFDHCVNRNHDFLLLKELRHFAIPFYRTVQCTIGSSSNCEGFLLPDLFRLYPDMRGFFFVRHSSPKNFALLSFLLFNSCKSQWRMINSLCRIISHTNDSLIILVQIKRRNVDNINRS